MSTQKTVLCQCCEKGDDGSLIKLVIRGTAVGVPALASRWRDADESHIDAGI